MIKVHLEWKTHMVIVWVRGRGAETFGQSAFGLKFFRVNEVFFLENLEDKLLGCALGLSRKRG